MNTKTTKMLKISARHKSLALLLVPKSCRAGLDHSFPTTRWSRF